MYACNKLLYEIVNYYNQTESARKPTEDDLSVSNTYTNSATLPVSKLEHCGALAPLKF